MKHKTQLEKASFSFSQEGNCVGSTGDYENLTVDFESSLGVDHDGDGFFVLRTEGWSIDGVGELEELFNRIKAVLEPKQKRNENTNTRGL